MAKGISDGAKVDLQAMNQTLMDYLQQSGYCNCDRESLDPLSLKEYF